jgi:hypothetical protein
MRDANYTIKRKSYDDPNAKRESFLISCPWCNADCEDKEFFLIHVENQHPDKRIDEKSLDRLCAWKDGKIHVMDI